MTRSDDIPAEHSRAPRAPKRALKRLVAASTVAAAMAVTIAGPAAAQTPGGGGPGGLGGSGTLTGRSGATLQLEGFAGTSKVVVTNSTEYRQVQQTDSSAITKGACIRVNGTGDTAEGVTATSVTVLDDPQACSTRDQTGRGQSGGFPPNGGSLPNGGSFPNGGSLPNGASLPNGGSFPNGGSLPNGGTFGQGGLGRGGVTGKVKSASGDTVIVTAQVPQQPTSANAQPKVTKQKVTVTLSDATPVSHTVDATESVLVIGTCVTATGNADSVGTVTAKTVTVSQPENGACTPSFGGGFGGPPTQRTT